MTKGVLHYVSTSSFPSMEANAIHVASMCNALARAGISVCLYARGGDPGNGPVGERIRFVRLSGPGRSVGKRIVGIGRVLIELLVRERTGYVFGRDAISIFLLVLFGRCSFVEMHEPPSTWFRRRLFSLVKKRRQLRGIVVITHALRDYLVNSLGADEESILVYPDCADIPSGEGPERTGPAIGSVTIGYAGSLHSGRGIEFLLVLANRLPEMNFNIAGGTAQQVEALKLCAPSNVRFYGHLAHERIPDFLSSCDILVAPYSAQVVSASGNATGRWMSPLKLFEYMASGRPLVTSRMPVLEEIIRDGVNGRLAGPENVDEWVEILRELAGSVQIREALGSAAFSEVCAKYTWDHRADAILRFIHER